MNLKAYNHKRRITAQVRFAIEALAAERLRANNVERAKAIADNAEAISDKVIEALLAHYTITDRRRR